jgi:hypothetical protein
LRLLFVSTVQVINHPSLNHRMEVTAGVLAGRCLQMIQEFFRHIKDSGGPISFTSFVSVY